MCVRKRKRVKKILENFLKKILEIPRDSQFDVYNIKILNYFILHRILIVRFDSFEAGFFPIQIFLTIAQERYSMILLGSLIHLNY